MNLEAAVAELDDTRTWNYIVDVATRTAPDLDLGPRAKAAIGPLVDALTDPDPGRFQRAVSAFRSGLQGDAIANLGYVTATMSIDAWFEMIAAGRETITGTPTPFNDCPVEQSRRIGDTLDGQWSTYARTVGIDDDLVDLWASLAVDWTGTPTELDEALELLATEGPQ